VNCFQQRSLKEKANQKKLLATLNRLKALRKEVEAARTEQERNAAERKLEKMEKLRKGLVGQRVGKHKVTEGDIDVQLGEDLSESLRGLGEATCPVSSVTSPIDGRLGRRQSFKDRLLSMQNRALVEPRARVLLVYMHFLLLQFGLQIYQPNPPQSQSARAGEIRLEEIHIILGNYMIAISLAK
jgi:hypothetical protein